MTSLIAETISIFKSRNQLNIKDGFSQERDIFNEMLAKNAQKNLGDTEYDLYQNARLIINRGLKLGRAQNLEAAIETFKEVERMLSLPSISFQCKMLIGSFYCSGLAYLRLKERKPEEADALSLQGLAIDNYLIQEHGYSILEMHRVQQILNLARIKFFIGQKDAAFQILFALLRCFENRSESPTLYRFNTLGFLKKMYASTPPIPSAIGTYNPFSIIGKWSNIPITRFKNNLDGNNLRADQNLFLLDFSDLSFELIERMLDQIIVEFIRFTKNATYADIRAILNVQGIQSTEDLKYWAKYQLAHLYLSMKIQAVHGEHQAFLTSLKSFCENSTSQPIWDAIAKDFYGFCEASGKIGHTIKNQVLNIAREEGFSKK